MAIRKKEVKHFRDRGITFTLLSSLLAVSLPLKASANQQTDNVYQVYLNGKYIGALDQPQGISKMAGVKKTKNFYRNAPIAIRDLVFIPVKRFHSRKNQTAINSLQVPVSSIALVVGGNIIAYFQNKKEAEKAVSQHIQKFLPEDFHVEMEELLANRKLFSAVQKGESQIIDVFLSKEVSFKEKKIIPEMIVSAEEGAKLLDRGYLQEIIYTVQKHDVLINIAAKFHLTLDQLLAFNPFLTKESIIRPGDKLYIQTYQPFFNVQVREKVMEKERVPYGMEIIRDATIPEGKEIVKQEGKEGIKLHHYFVYKINGKQVRKEPIKEEILQKPIKKVIIKGTKAVSSRGQGVLKWPAAKGYVSSKMGQRWGRMHKGIDIARPANRTIVAADDGTVISAGYDGGYGNKIVIDHHNGMRTVYAHLHSISVSAGQTVTQGQKIGIMGSTGNSTGVHLHFEVYQNGKLQNPLNYLK